MFTSFSVARKADGIESARLWSILPVSNIIADLPGLEGDCQSQYLWSIPCCIARSTEIAQYLRRLRNNID